MYRCRVTLYQPLSPWMPVSRVWHSVSLMAFSSFIFPQNSSSFLNINSTTSSTTSLTTSSTLQHQQKITIRESLLDNLGWKDHGVCCILPYTLEFVVAKHEALFLFNSNAKIPCLGFATEGKDHWLRWLVIALYIPQVTARLKHMMYLTSSLRTDRKG